MAGDVREIYRILRRNITECIVYRVTIDQRLRCRIPSLLMPAATYYPFSLFGSFNDRSD
jgi:hypothetical protein